VKTPKIENHHVTNGDQGVAMKPPAKLNISLVVFGARADGYHDLHTVMATINLYDDLHLKFADKPGIHLYCTGLECPANGENLTYKAAELLAHHVRLEPAVDIYLHKRIPAGGGLGGASSDAAACLLGLNRLWSLNLPQEELELIGSQIGSDVPFFLNGPVALCTGRGEIVQKLPHRCKTTILLIIPDIHISTAQVYRNYTFDENKVNEDIRRARYFLCRGDLDGLLIQGINSLTEITMSLSEALQNLRYRLNEMGIAEVHMTGSGSCLFAVSESMGEVTAWEQEIKRQNIAQPLQVSFYDHNEIFLEKHHADF